MVGEINGINQGSYLKRAPIVLASAWAQFSLTNVHQTGLKKHHFIFPISTYSNISSLHVAIFSHAENRCETISFLDVNFSTRCHTMHFILLHYFLQSHLHHLGGI